MSSPKTSYSSQSFRDRDGYVVIEKNLVKRYVHQSYAQHYNQLMLSGLYEQLVSRKLLISHQESSEIPENGYFKILEPHFIPFISYPYEWTFEQWKEVALKTLEINQIAIHYGMILKDASPFNFSWHQGQSVFIDSLSFELYVNGEPWKAYRQFCESILGPLSLMAYCHSNWGQLFQNAINGWDLPFISQSLPIRSWNKQTILLHIHLHSKSQKSSHPSKVKTKMDTEKLVTLWNMMEHGIRKLKQLSNKKTWANYYQESVLSQDYLEEKTGIMASWFPLISSYRIIDLGANTGKFSLQAAPYFKHVIAFESDIDCVQKIREGIGEHGFTNIDTVWGDLTQPNSGHGWANEERLDLISRLASDCILSLALIHHLCISKNIRIEMVAKLFARLTSQWAIVEFVPKTDEKVIEMLQNRKDVFDDYTEENYMHSFQQHFILRKQYCFKNSNRTLYLWEKK